MIKTILAAEAVVLLAFWIMQAAPAAVEGWGPVGVAMVLGVMTTSVVSVISAIYSARASSKTTATHEAVVKVEKATNGHYESLEKRLTNMEQRLADALSANTALQERLLSAEKRALSSKPEGANP